MSILFVRPLTFVLDDIPNFFLTQLKRGHSVDVVYGDIVKSNVYKPL